MGGGGTEMTDLCHELPSHERTHSRSRLSPLQGRTSPDGRGKEDEWEQPKHKSAARRGSKDYILPPMDNKYDRALARHYELKFPPSSAVDQDTSSMQWLQGTVGPGSNLSQTQPVFRPKTPNCPWGVDRKMFKLSPSRLSTAISARKPRPSGRSHSSLDVHGSKDGYGKGASWPDLFTSEPVVPQVIPGYTGHFTGFRETVGTTYGHAEQMLGRMSPACVPMYSRDDIVGDDMGICRSGYPTFVRHHNRWSRRPNTAMRPLVKDPIFREAGVDIIKHLSNMLVERVPGKTSCPIKKVLLDLRRACMKCAMAAPLMDQEEACTMFRMMKVELTEKERDQLFDTIGFPEDKGMIRIETLCQALEEKSNDHPLAPSSSRSNTLRHRMVH